MVFTLSWNKSQPWLAAKSCAALRLCMSQTPLSADMSTSLETQMGALDSPVPATGLVLSLEVQARWVRCAALILATDENLVPYSRSFCTCGSNETFHAMHQSSLLSSLSSSLVRPSSGSTLHNVNRILPGCEIPRELLCFLGMAFIA